MNSDNFKNTRLYKAIDEVLHYLWDPIGVYDVPQARDEYSTYSAEVYKLVTEGANKQTIAEYLYKIETEWMGLQPKNINHCLGMAEIILEWRDYLKDQLD